MSKIFQATDVGKVRYNNEDSLAVIEPETFVVADGMGGQAAGEIASQMLVSTVQKFLSETFQTWDENILTQAILKSNDEILKTAKSDEKYRGMGTTATVLHLENGRAFYAHIGDSRIYLLRKNNLEQITQDHSYVETLVRNGKITPEEAKRHPMKNVLVQAVGAMLNLSVDAGNFFVESGDIFLLCTDGLTNMVDNEHIKKILLEHAEKNPAVELTNAALENGGRDNISVIVVECD